jgi:hypothetical protein
MCRPLLIYLLLLTAASVCPTAEAGWCKRQVLRVSFAVQEKLQSLHSRESGKFLEEIESKSVRLDLQPNWREFIESAWRFELELFRLPFPFVSELAKFRQLSFLQRQRYLAEVGAELDRRLLALTDGSAIGFHYNKSGGSAAEFVWRGGIYASHGNLRERRALTPRGGMRGNESNRPVIMGPPTVFYFHSGDTRFSDFVVSSLYRSTPNDVAIFDVLKVEAVVGVEPARGYYGRAFSFPNRGAGQIGVSVDTFVIPPARLLTVNHLREAFPDGSNLTYEEIELAALRHFTNYLEKLSSN